MENISAAEITWKIRVFHDGDCPLCQREINLIRRLDDDGLIDLVDLSTTDFNASDYGLEQATIEARIHAALPNGEVVEGVEVFTRIYEALGYGWLTAPAHWPGIRWILDRAYLVFARNRLRWTGRAPSLCEIEDETTPA